MSTENESLTAEVADTVAEAVVEAVVEEVVEEVVEDLQGEAVESDLAVLTGDLQRLQAEYLNYRKRVERDRALSHELAVGAVLAELLPVLDDLDRAKDHGELNGGFKAVADRLIGVTTKLGLEQYGEVGTTFDPQIHEALSHTTSAEVSETTATSILQPGYKYKNRILRPARVAVTDPE